MSKGSATITGSVTETDSSRVVPTNLHASRARPVAVGALATEGSATIAADEPTRPVIEVIVTATT